MRTLEVAGSAAALWLTDPALASVRAQAATPLHEAGRAVPDVVASRPEALVAAVQQAARLAVVHDAPPGVAEELAGAARRLSLGTRQSGFDYARAQLASLVGLRDSTEVVPVLSRAIESAPDESSRSILRRMAAAANDMPVFLGPDGYTRVVVTIPDRSGAVDLGGPGGEPGGAEGPIDMGGPGEVIDVAPIPTTVLEAPEDVSAVAAAGAAIGEQIATDLGLDAGAVQAAQAGAQTAISQTQLGTFGSGAEAGGGGWCSVGTAIGSLIGGPAGAAIGCGVAVAISHTEVGHVVTGAVQGAQQWLHHHLDGAEAPIEVVIACILCGETCLICVVTADGLSSLH